MFENKKILSVAIDISQFLFDRQWTYDEVEGILSLLQAEFKQRRENYEYDTFEDWKHNHKTAYANDIVIKPLKHIDEFC